MLLSVSDMPGIGPTWIYAFAVATPEEHAADRLVMRKAVFGAIAILGIIFALFLGYTLRTLLFYVFVALFVAVAFEPPVHYLAKRGWKRGSATGVVFLAALLLTIGFIWALAPLFVEQISQLIEAIPEMVKSFLGWLESTFGFDFSNLELEDASQDFVGYLQSIGGTLAGGLLSVAAGIGGFLIFVTTVALFSFYMIAELPQLQRTVLSAMPEKEQRRALRIWDIAVENMGGYIYSRLILAVLSATLTTIVLSVLEVPWALSLGIWVGVMSQFIPVVGTYLAAILPAIVALTFNDLTTAVIATLYFVAYQQVENYYFSPRITKRTMEIHPAVSVGAIIAGSALMGGIGVILALPMTGIIQAIISESRKHYDVVVDNPDFAPPATAPED